MTLPVKFSAGPLLESWEPARSMVCDGLPSCAFCARLAKAADKTSAGTANRIAVCFISSPCMRLLRTFRMFLVTYAFISIT